MSTRKNEKKTTPEVAKYVEGIPGGKIDDIPMNKIDLDYNELEFRVSPRVKDLVEDIRVNGQQFPIVLRGIESSRKFQIVSGYRRYRAIRELGWPAIKAVVRNDLDDDAAYMLSFLENEKRKNLTGVDKANAIAKLRVLGKTDQQIQKIFGIGERQFRRYEKVGRFPPMLKNAILKGAVETTHGLELMKYFEAGYLTEKSMASLLLLMAKKGATVSKLKKVLKRDFPSKKGRKTRYMETKKNGGFRLYPMSFDPKKTDKSTRETMIAKLNEALKLLEQQS